MISKTKRIYTGPTLLAKGLVARLNDAGIHPIERNDHDSSVKAGFTASIPYQTMVFVREDQLKIAKPILDAYLKELKTQ